MASIILLAMIFTIQENEKYFICNINFIDDLSYLWHNKMPKIF
jgi:hypothetical protein